MKNFFWLDGTLHLNTRDMARFGLLINNRGTWDKQAILTDEAYFNAMMSTSQNLNQSYGYLWWLNGKSSSMMPGGQNVFPGSMAPNAPADLIMALGKDDKKIYIVPSLGLVVVRQGDDAGTSGVGPTAFDDIFWSKLRLAVKKW